MINDTFERWGVIDTELDTIALFNSRTAARQAKAMGMAYGTVRKVLVSVI